MYESRGKAAAEKQMADHRRRPDELDALCRETDTDRNGILRLMFYYTDRCGWSKEQAVEHIRKLFANGTIEEIKQL